jgi:SH3 domain protein
MLKNIVFAGLFSVVTLTAWSETVYIKDVLNVNLRSGKGFNYRILEADLPSGTKLNRVREEEDEQGRQWTFVESERGNQGWMESQYLQEQQIARDRLVAAERQLATLKQQQQSSGGQISDLELRNAQVTEALQVANNQMAKLSEELDNLKRVSADAVNIDRRNQTLIEEREELKTRVDVLENRNQQLSDDSNQTWFLYGAFAVGIGCLLTLIVQKIRIRRRHSEWA